MGEVAASVSVMPPDCTVVPVTTLKRTPLYDRHVAANAKTADFGGWEMPIEYSGVVAEHTAVRTAVGIFDVSHMGKVRLHGEGAKDALNAVLANDLDRIADGQAQYSMLLNHDGGVVDDLIVYRWSPDEVFIVPNASNAASVVEALRAAMPSGVTVDDHHLTHGIIAVQGPHSRALIASLGFPADHAYMSMAQAEYRGEPVIVCRSGYTGELGYELVAPNEILVDLWDALLARRDEFGLVRAGLGARDTLRTEMGYPLHGQDISQDISPVQAGLGWAIGWAKPEFAGRDAVTAEKAAGPARRLRGIRSLDRGIPRSHMAVLVDGESVGEVTSGTFSPTLKQGIALALLAPTVAIGDEVAVDVRGRQSRFQVVALPFVPSSVKG